MISLQETKAHAAWATNLPTKWKLCRLKSVASIRYGLGQPPAELSSGVAMIRATDVDAGMIRTDSFLQVDPAELPLDRNPYLKAGEIIVVRSGAYTGDSAIVPQALEGSVAGYDMVATVTRASPKFVAYGLLSKYVLEDQIHLLTLRAAQPHLNAEELGSVVLAMPPSREDQERIAAYLDASCAAIDAAVTAKRRQLETLDAFASSILLQALTIGLRPNVETRPTGASVLPQVPVAWRFVRLKSVAAIRYGLGQPPPELSSGVAMIRATDVDAGTIRTENLLRVDPAELPRDRNPYLKAGEIIVVRSGAYTGDSAIIPLALEGTVAGYDMVVTVTRASSRFIAYCLLSRYVLEGQLLLLTLRAAQPHLNAEELGGVLLALPPTREEQEAIADHLDVKLAKVKCIATGIKAQIAMLTAYRNSLIHECVTGQRRISDADLNRV